MNFDLSHFHNRSFEYILNLILIFVREFLQYTLFTTVMILSDVISNIFSVSLIDGKDVVLRAVVVRTISIVCDMNIFDYPFDKQVSLLKVEFEFILI